MKHIFRNGEAGEEIIIIIFIVDIIIIILLGIVWLHNDEGLDFL